MTRSRLIFVFRFCLLAAIAIWFGVPWYMVAMSPVPLALFMPVFAAVVLTCDDACNTGFPFGGNSTITISGVTGCTNFNATWVTGDTLGCDGTAGCTGAGAHVSGSGASSRDVKRRVTKSGTDAILNVYAVINSNCFIGTYIGRWSINLGTAPVDCVSAVGSQSAATGTNILGATCDVSAASMSITTP